MKKIIKSKKKKFILVSFGVSLILIVGACLFFLNFNDNDSNNKLNEDKSFKEWTDKINFNGKEIGITFKYYIEEKNIENDEQESKYTIFKESIAIDGKNIVNDLYVGFTKLGEEDKKDLLHYKPQKIKDKITGEEYLIIYLQKNNVYPPIPSPEPAVYARIYDKNLNEVQELVSREANSWTWIAADGNNDEHFVYYDEYANENVIYYNENGSNLLEVHDDYIYRLESVVDENCKQTIKEYVITFENGVYKEEFNKFYDDDSIIRGSGMAC